VLALTRQNLPLLRHDVTSTNRCTAGAYEIVAAEGIAQVSLFATGSEVALAIEAQRLLAAQGIATRVVSVPCFELLFVQPPERQRAVIGDAPVKIAVEAAIRQGWDAIIGADGAFVGMTGFGASAPAKELYEHFGITTEAVVQAALAKHRKS
jgi:transketolase